MGEEPKACVLSCTPLLAPSSRQGVWVVVVHASGWGRKSREQEECEKGWASQEGAEGAGSTGLRAEEAEAEKAAWTRNSSLRLV